MKKQEECIELKNIQYQNMLLGGNKMKINSSVENINNIEAYLERERNENKKKPWSKLSNASKLKKIKIYVEEYSKKNKFQSEQKNDMTTYLELCLTRKKFQKMKDVEYDIETGIITNIPSLHYNKNTRKFTLKNNKVSILKNLAPKTRKKKDKKKRETKTNKSKDKKNPKSKDKKNPKSKDKKNPKSKDKKHKNKKIRTKSKDKKSKHEKDK